ncbi:MAG TPA: cytochrome c-type biogenesis protein CcmH [Acidimicrobiales bacterium]|nr:cytochrome c-type biogenesis protein CcmH [Acidimicrobiales bacterium]
MSRRLSWIALAVVLVAALAVGVTDDRLPRTEAERVSALASEIQCPTCAGLSAAESDAKAAQAVRDEIREQLRDGRTGAEIRAYFVSRYGRGILLKPEASGVAGLVWALPVALGLLALVALVATFRRWRRERDALDGPSDEDRALVESALS